MCCNSKYAKFVVLLLIGIFFVSFSLSGDTSSHSVLQPSTPAIYQVTDYAYNRDPLAYLFQIIFILFFISPPIIAVLLFLIYRELKERNKSK